MAFVAGSGFSGGKIASKKAICRGETTVVKMSADGGLSRRDLMLGALAAMVPASALAKAGDGPKYSIFGGGASSSPFVYMDKKKGSVLYKALNDDEVAFISGQLKESRERLASTDESIAYPSWDDVRSTIRLQMYSARRNMIKLNDNIDDKKQADKAKQLYQKVKKDIEDLDYACQLKDQARARKARSSALKDFDLWAASAGLDL